MSDAFQIGSRLFTDGTTRPVYRDEQGQYVLDDANGNVYGHWLLTDDDGPDFSDWSDVAISVDIGNQRRPQDENPRGGTRREPPLPG
jgi:hypothetical protein